MAVFRHPYGFSLFGPLSKIKIKPKVPRRLIKTLTANSETLTIVVAAEVKSDGDGGRADDQQAVQDPANGDGDAEGSRVPGGGP